MILVIIPLVLLVAYVGYELFGVLSNVLASQSNFNLNSTLTQISVYVPLDSVINTNNLDSTI